MANIRAYKKKIKSAKNIAKITRAMQMVSASKMKRAQEQAQASRAYSEGIANFSRDLTTSMNFGDFIHPLLSIKKENINKKELVLYIAPEKGLCGGLLSNLYRFVEKEFVVNKNDIKEDYVVIGKKAKTHVTRFGGNIVAEFSLGLSQPSYDNIPSVARFVREAYLTGNIDKVSGIYMKFISTLEQEPVAKTLLPLDLVEVEKSEEKKEILDNNFFVFEPFASDIAASVLDRYLEVELYQLVLEAYASEQSARMIAMKNATDNANDLITDLTMGYNKERQASITSEILDISSGALVQ